MLFGLLQRKDINQGVKDFRATPAAVLLDVRTKEEYNQYHIDGSINIPLQRLGMITSKITNKNTPIFVHCLSGGRSAQAAAMLTNAGYKNVRDIGGINSYREETV